MKQLIIIIAALFTTVFSFAQNRSDVNVNSYYRSNGTYVAPHYRTAPNSTVNDNYSTRPNVNPYTGSIGTKAPDYTPSTSSWNTPSSNTRSSSSSSYWNTPSYSTPRRRN